MDYRLKSNPPGLKPAVILPAIAGGYPSSGLSFLPEVKSCLLRIELLRYQNKPGTTPVYAMTWIPLNAQQPIRLLPAFGEQPQPQGRAHIF
jgi:hypothetical protein